MLAELDEHPHPAALADQIDPEDLRRHRLTIMPAGRKVLTKGLALISDAFESRLARLSAAEQAQFGSLLEKLS